MKELQQYIVNFKNDLYNKLITKFYPKKINLSIKQYTTLSNYIYNKENLFKHFTFIYQESLIMEEKILLKKKSNKLFLLNKQDIKFEELVKKPYFLLEKYDFNNIFLENHIIKEHQILIKTFYEFKKYKIIIYSDLKNYNYMENEDNFINFINSFKIFMNSFYYFINKLFNDIFNDIKNQIKSLFFLLKNIHNHNILRLNLLTIDFSEYFETYDIFNINNETIKIINNIIKNINIIKEILFNDEMNKIINTFTRVLEENFLSNELLEYLVTSKEYRDYINDLNNKYQTSFSEKGKNNLKNICEKYKDIFISTEFSEPNHIKGYSENKDNLGGILISGRFNHSGTIYNSLPIIICSNKCYDNLNTQTNTLPIILQDKFSLKKSFCTSLFLENNYIGIKMIIGDPLAVNLLKFGFILGLSSGDFYIIRNIINNQNVDTLPNYINHQEVKEKLQQLNSETYVRYVKQHFLLEVSLVVKGTDDQANINDSEFVSKDKIEELITEYSEKTIAELMNKNTI